MAIRLALLVALLATARGDPCSSIDFGCFSGECVPYSRVCDNTADCSDGSDERADYCTRDAAPTVLDLLTELLAANPGWRNYVPDDTDQDNDGELSVAEIEKKYKEYWDVAVDILDQDKDGVVSKEEMKRPRLNITDARNIWNMYSQTYPIKQLFRSMDHNGDGFLEREDFNLAGYSCGPRYDYRTGQYGPLPTLTDAQREECVEKGSDVWNRAGRYITIADRNGDGRVTLEEIRDKAATDFLEEYFDLYDMDGDGELTVDDILPQNMRFSRSDLIAAITKVFAAIDLDGDGVLNLGTDIPGLGASILDSRRPRRYRFDKNGDGKITMKDMDGMRGMGGFNILARLSKDIDLNQDGKVGLEELLNFVQHVFNWLDRNDDDNISVDDVVKRINDIGVPLDKVEAMEVYIVSLSTFYKETYTRMVDQFVKEVDENKDGSLSRQELYGVRKDLFQGNGFYKFRMEWNGPAMALPRMDPPINIWAIIDGILDEAMEGTNNAI